MLLSNTTQTLCSGSQTVVETPPAADQAERIRAALGPLEGRPPCVDEYTLARYYRHLKARLSLPFAAMYPEPKTARDEAEYGCNVVKLYDPTDGLGDELDGIFCKTRKGRFEVNLPLVELHVPKDSPNRQLLDDYRHWFWNWRRA